jgi:hypothetical protein
MRRMLRRALRLLGRALRLLVLCLGALGPGMPPPPPVPRRQQEVQVDGAEEDDAER